MRIFELTDIKRYLYGETQGEEKAFFETEMKNNASFKEEVRVEALIYQTLEERKEAEFMARLNQKMATSTSSKTIVPTPHRPIRFNWQNTYKWVAGAVVCISLGFYFLSESKSEIKKQNEEFVTQTDSNKTVIPPVQSLTNPLVAQKEDKLLIPKIVPAKPQISPTPKKSFQQIQLFCNLIVLQKKKGS